MNKIKPASGSIPLDLRASRAPKPPHRELDLSVRQFPPNFDLRHVGRRQPTIEEGPGSHPCLLSRLDEGPAYTAILRLKPVPGTFLGHVIGLETCRPTVRRSQREAHRNMSAEVVEFPRAINLLREGAGQNVTLKQNGHFEQVPHHHAGRKYCGNSVLPRLGSHVAMNRKPRRSGVFEAYGP